MATLYRQYRPQKFAELVGQEHVSETLRAAIQQNRLAHAYLLYGPRGTGKTTTARLLAKAANCSAVKIGEPCGKCASCRAVVGGSHVDVVEIDAASNRGIDDVRVLREAAKFVPGLGKRKVYIIDEVHMLTKEAASALLKILEEPPRHVLFVLATTELHKVLPTIASRCQVFRFRRATSEEMRGRLTDLLGREKRQANAEVLDYIVERSDGCYRDAESLLGQLLTLTEKEIALEELTAFLGLPAPATLDNFLTALVKGESAPALAALDEAFAAGVDVEQFLTESVRQMRDGAIYVARGQSADADRLGKWTAAVPELEQKAPAIIRALLQAMQDLAYVPQPLMAAQLAILTVCTHKGEVRGRQEIVRERSAPKLKVAEQPVSGGASLEKIKQAWPRLIENMKDKNPVASTFLRALEPMKLAGSEFTATAYYALHKTFFDKPDNKQLLAQELSELLGEEVQVNLALAEVDEGSERTRLARKNKSEKDFIAAVQEVFG